jgi:hypothetical protein
LTLLLVVQEAWRCHVSVFLAEVRALVQHH